MIDNEKNERAMDYMVKKTLSLNERIIQLEAENKRLRAANELLLVEKAQWIASREQWSQIMQRTLTASNETSAKVSEEIQELSAENIRLREELSYLKGG